MKIEDCRRLFAMTGNQCAFPDCTQQLIDQDGDYLGNVCHIEASRKSGPRFNLEMTNEERDSVNNLIVLCPTHHTIVDKKESVYKVDCLRKMKADHENKYAGNQFELSDNAIQQILKEQTEFQHYVNLSNRRWRECFDLAMELEFSDDPSVHLNEIVRFISQLEQWMNDICEFTDNLPNEIENFFNEIGYDLTMYKTVPYYKNPFYNCFWEFLHIGVPNILNFIKFHSIALETHITIQKLKENPDATSLQIKVGKLKAELLKLASTLVHFD